MPSNGILDSGSFGPNIRLDRGQLQRLHNEGSYIRTEREIVLTE